ncbi:multiple sugar transport system permease protein [Lachnospiraceae bacterium C7]|nr:multiple sugar transport system permease protein [Lachnospiraceae bacterium C7]
MKNKKNKISKAWFFLMPSFLGVCIFYIYPLLDVVRRSFVNSEGSEFVGIDNYVEVFKNEAFQLAASNTIRFIFIGVPIILVISLWIAVKIVDNVWLEKQLKHVLLLPMTIPVVSLIIVWRFLFDSKGIVNGLLHIFGIAGVKWLTTDSSFYVLILSFIWKNLGYCTIIWIVGLLAVPEEIYEAADIDGAGRYAKFWYVTLPNIIPTIVLQIILGVINTFKVYREAYLIAGDYPADGIYMLQHLFNNWFRELEISKMATAATINLIVITLLALFVKKLGEVNYE